MSVLLPIFDLPDSLQHPDSDPDLNWHVLIVPQPPLIMRSDPINHKIGDNQSEALPNSISGNHAGEQLLVLQVSPCFELSVVIALVGQRAQEYLLLEDLCFWGEMDHDH